MVLMGAEQVPGEEDLSAQLENDLEEMGRVECPPDGRLNLYAQVHANGKVRLHDFGKDTVDDLSMSEEALTDGTALKNFMRSVLCLPEHRPGDRSMLVLWGHSYDFAIGRAVTRSGVDALDFSELAGVLRSFKEAYDVTPDIVGFDACDVSTVEMACQLHGLTDYVLASQVGIPLPGWPYDRVLDRLSNPHGRVMGAAELGSYIVRRYCETYHALERSVSLTLLDIGRAEELQRLTEDLSRRLLFAMDESADEFDLISSLFVAAQTTEEKPFVDVAELCASLLRTSRNAALRTSAKRLGDFLISPGPVRRGKSETGEGRPFVADYGRNSCEMARLQGVSLYAPHVDEGHDFERAKEFYGRFTFAKETLWNDVVTTLVHSALALE